jgi:hypothetical protein
VCLYHLYGSNFGHPHPPSYPPPEPHPPPGPPPPPGPGPKPVPPWRDLALHPELAAPQWLGGWLNAPHDSPDAPEAQMAPAQMDELLAAVLIQRDVPLGVRK